MRPPPYEVAWCHGAAGIGLARLHAAEVTGQCAHLDVARIAVRTVASAATEVLRRNPRHATEGTGLCHGLAGYQVVLAAASAGTTSQLDAVDSALCTAAESQVGAVTDPGLMCGRAGLAMCLLAPLRDSVLRELLGGPRQHQASTAGTS